MQIHRYTYIIIYIYVYVYIFTYACTYMAYTATCILTHTHTDKYYKEQMLAGYDYPSIHQFCYPNIANSLKCNKAVIQFA